ncbi:MAG: Uncharacterised protein [Prochlorococcus marinus str. MIT 9215]|nr:MAG: Uncharacterised protein [Prochlorococcus marinus str. MIT 9215]
MNTSAETGTNLQRAIQPNYPASIDQHLESSLPAIGMVRRAMLINIKDNPAGLRIRPDCQVLRLATSQAKVFL